MNGQDFIRDLPRAEAGIVRRTQRRQLGIDAILWTALVASGEAARAGSFISVRPPAVHSSHVPRNTTYAIRVNACHRISRMEKRCPALPAQPTIPAWTTRRHRRPRGPSRGRGGRPTSPGDRGGDRGGTDGVRFRTSLRRRGKGLGFGARISRWPHIPPESGLRFSLPAGAFPGAPCGSPQPGDPGGRPGRHIHVTPMTDRCHGLPI